MGYTCLFQFWFPPCICPAVGLLGHIAVLFPVFKEISTLFSIVAVLVFIPTNNVRGFPFLHTLSSLGVCRLFDGSHSDWCEMVPHYGFDLHYLFPGGSDGKASACKAGDLGSIPGWEDPLEKEMATHSSTVAWKVPWTEEPCKLQSMGSQRVRHD